MPTASEALVIVPIRRLAAPGTCPACGAEAELHQPGRYQPDRLLLTCDECGGWAVVVFHPGDEDALALIVPDEGDLLRSWEDAFSPG